jgi:ketosteroid isomerase-like protein
MDKINEATLVRLAEGFRTKDIDAILAEFAENGVFEHYAGPESCGERFAGKAAIRTALERMAKAPDFVLENTTRWFVGDRAVAEFTYVRTSEDGERVEIRGCDLFTLRDGKVLRKDTYLKQIRPPSN